MWRLNNYWSMKKSKEKKCMKTNENGNMTYQNLWNAAKTQF